MSRKISILIHSLSGGGSERVVSILVEHLLKQDYNIILVFIYNRFKYTIPENTECHFLSEDTENQNMIINFLKIPYYSYRYYQLLIKHKIDVSISFLTRPNYINIITKLFISKILIVINERSFPSQEYKGYSIKSIINRYLIRLLYNYSDLVLTNSLGNSIDLISNFKINSNLVSTVNNPIDLEIISNTPKATDFFDNNYINFITVGRIDDNKNHEFLINMIARLNRIDVRLYIIGEGVLIKKLKEKVNKLKLCNNVFFIGHIENPYKYMKSADAFLFSSKSEGFPNVLLEAITCNLPVITHNCKSGPDEIFFNEILEVKETIKSNFCQLVPYDNLTLFVEAVNYYIENKHLFIIDELNKKIFLERFNKKYILDKYLGIINNNFKH